MTSIDKIFRPDFPEGRFSHLQSGHIIGGVIGTIINIDDPAKWGRVQIQCDQIAPNTPLPNGADGWIHVKELFTVNAKAGGTHGFLEVGTLCVLLPILGDPTQMVFLGCLPNAVDPPSPQLNRAEGTYGKHTPNAVFEVHNDKEQSRIDSYPHGVTELISATGDKTIQTRDGGRFQIKADATIIHENNNASSKIHPDGTVEQRNIALGSSVLNPQGVWEIKSSDSSRLLLNNINGMVEGPSGPLHIAANTIIKAIPVSMDIFKTFFDAANDLIDIYLNNKDAVAFANSVSPALSDLLQGIQNNLPTIQKNIDVIGLNTEILIANTQSQSGIFVSSGLGDVTDEIQAIIENGAFLSGSVVANQIESILPSNLKGILDLNTLGVTLDGMHGDVVAQFHLVIDTLSSGGINSISSVLGLNLTSSAQPIQQLLSSITPPSWLITGQTPSTTEYNNWQASLSGSVSQLKLLLPFDYQNITNAQLANIINRALLGQDAIGTLMDLIASPISSSVTTGSSSATLQPIQNYLNSLTGPLWLTLGDTPTISEIITWQSQLSTFISQLRTKLPSGNDAITDVQLSNIITQSILTSSSQGMSILSGLLVLPSAPGSLLSTTDQVQTFFNQIVGPTWLKNGLIPAQSEYDAWQLTLSGLISQFKSFLPSIYSSVTDSEVADIITQNIVQGNGFSLFSDLVAKRNTALTDTSGQTIQGFLNSLVAPSWLASGQKVSTAAQNSWESKLADSVAQLRSLLPAGHEDITDNELAEVVVQSLLGENGYGSLLGLLHTKVINNFGAAVNTGFDIGNSIDPVQQLVMLMHGVNLDNPADIFAASISISAVTAAFPGIPINANLPIDQIIAQLSIGVVDALATQASNWIGAVNTSLTSLMLSVPSLIPSARVVAIHDELQGFSNLLDKGGQIFVRNAESVMHGQSQQTTVRAGIDKVLAHVGILGTGGGSLFIDPVKSLMRSKNFSSTVQADASLVRAFTDKYGSGGALHIDNGTSKIHVANLATMKVSNNTIKAYSGPNTFSGGCLQIEPTHSQLFGPGQTSVVKCSGTAIDAVAGPFGLGALLKVRSTTAEMQGLARLSRVYAGPAIAGISSPAGFFGFGGLGAIMSVVGTLSALVSDGAGNSSSMTIDPATGVSMNGPTVAVNGIDIPGKFSQYDNHFNQIDQRIISIDTEIVNIHSHLTLHNTQIAALQSGLQADQYNIYIMQNTVATLQSAVQAAQYNVYVMQNTVAAMQTAVNTLQTDMTAAQSSLVANGYNISTIQSTLVADGYNISTILTRLANAGIA